MDTDFLYSTLSVEIWKTLLFQKKEMDGINYIAHIPRKTSPRTQQTISSPEPACCNTQKKYDKREPGHFKEEFRCSEMLSLQKKVLLLRSKEQ